VGIADQVRPPQEAQRTRRLTVRPTGKRPPGTQINGINKKRLLEY
jgi:hypothetical protein